jgi:aminoglycoside 6'-N-acetyltransferase I
MEAAERWARDRGYADLASDALLENSLSHAAHEALGFDIVERIVVFRKSLRS